MTDLLLSDKIHLSELELFLCVLQWGKWQLKNAASAQLPKKRKNSLILRKKVMAKQASLVPNTPVSATTPKQPFANDKKNDSTPFANSTTTTTTTLANDTIFERLSISELGPPNEPTETEMSFTETDADEEEELDEEEKKMLGDFEKQQKLINATLTTTLIHGSPQDLNQLLNYSTVTPLDIIQKRFELVVDYLSDKTFTKQLKTMLAEVLPHIRFPILTPAELYDYVEPTKVVPKELLLEAYRSHALINRVEVSEGPRLKVREGSLFYMSGVLENIPLKALRGWTCCYRKPYSDKTSETVFQLATGTRILVAARHKNSPNLTLCAMGRKSKVLKETFENETVKENGVYWYHWKNHSFGFSNSSSINLGSADLLAGVHKLSWHLTGRGGYRVGEIKNLNESDEWEKISMFAIVLITIISILCLI